MTNPTAVIELLKLWYPGHNWPDENWRYWPYKSRRRKRKGRILEGIYFQNLKYVGYDCGQESYMTVWLPRGEYGRALATLEMGIV